MSTALQIAWFHIKVFLAKAVIVFVALPVGTAILLYLIARREETWDELFSLYSYKEWKRAWGKSIEAIIGCRWFIIDAPRPKWPVNLGPKYAYWDDEERLVCCLFLEDAVFLNLKMGGTLVTRKGIPKKNTAREQTEW